MARWEEIEAEAPELAAAARRYFDAHVHKTLATVRRDGSPRISGIEATFADGDLWLAMMWRSVKALDLRRDPRFALHSGSDDPPAWTGDAKLAGVVEEVDDVARLPAVLRDGRSAHGEAHFFRADILELVVVTLSEARDRLVIEFWHPKRGVQRIERT